jgi:hypothetical protein
MRRADCIRDSNFFASKKSIEKTVWFDDENAPDLHSFGGRLASGIRPESPTVAFPNS